MRRRPCRLRGIPPPLTLRSQTGASIVASLVAIGLLLIGMGILAQTQGFWARETRITRKRGDLDNILAIRLTDMRGRIARRGLGPFLRRRSSSMPNAFNPALDVSLNDAGAFQAAFGLTVTQDTNAVYEEQQLKLTDAGVSDVKVRITYRVTVMRYKSSYPLAAEPILPTDTSNNRVADAAFLQIDADIRGVAGKDFERIRSADQLIVSM
jgi:hypothetical protein